MPPPRSRSPFPESIRPKPARSDTSYSEVDPARRRDGAVDDLLDRLKASQEREAEARAEAERLRESKPKVESEPVGKDGIRITISRATAVGIISAVVGTGGLGFGIKAWAEAEKRAEKPVVRAHVAETNTQMDDVKRDISALRTFARETNRRLLERDCWWVGVLEQSLSPGASVRLPDGVNCALVEISTSVPRKRGDPPIVEIKTVYPE